MEHFSVSEEWERERASLRGRVAELQREKSGLEVEVSLSRPADDRVAIQRAVLRLLLGTTPQLYVPSRIAWSMRPGCVGLLLLQTRCAVVCGFESISVSACDGDVRD